MPTPIPPTKPNLSSIEAELRHREPIFHRQEFGKTRADFAAMMTPEFWETGASGQRYTREFILDTLEHRQQNPTEDPWETSDFRCQEIAPHNYLLTYTLAQGQRLTRRATLWRQVDGAWKIVYHQGTVVAPT